MTNQVNDDKQTALAPLAGIGIAKVNDREMETIRLEGFTGTLNERWMQLFIDAGISPAAFDDMAFQYLTVKGYTGTLPEMWHKYWEDGGGFTPASESAVLFLDNTFATFIDDTQAEFL